MATNVAKLLPRFLPYDELGSHISMFHGSAGWANFAIGSIPDRDNSDWSTGSIFADILEGRFARVDKDHNWPVVLIGRKSSQTLKAMW